MTDSLKNWHIEQDENQIIWLTIDKADSGTNVLSSEVLEELDSALVTIASRHPKALVLASAKDNGFIAGADVTEFAQINDSSQAEQFIKKAHSIFFRLENMNMPTVCMIKGFCLGGGLELALCCDYRVCSDDITTKLGFPEVKLGIFPGFGGSVRSVNLIGSLPALNMMLTGRAMSARFAKKTGLIDNVVPQRHLKRAAIQLIETRPAKSQPSFIHKMATFGLVRPLIAHFMKKMVSGKAHKKQYPAPFVLIDHWKKYADMPTEMYLNEARSVAQLITGSTSKNLVRVYLLQEQLKTLGNKKDFTPRHVHVIGAGIMGGDIAIWCALKGFQVTLQDQRAEAIGPVIKRAHTLYKKKLKSTALINEAMDRLQPDTHGTGVKRADVVIEAIFENIEVKQNLYREIEPLLKKGALLATNTSSIPLETLGEALKQPDRLVGLHFFNPVSFMQLVEVVKTENTSPTTLKKAFAFSRHIDRLPLPVKSSPGFLVNRVLMPYLMEAVVLESEGVPGVLIDKAAKKFGMPMGPIELADIVGLDICLSVGKILAQTRDDIKIPGRIQQLVDSGHLGKKTGRGFYAHYKGRTIKPEIPTGFHEPADLAGRLVLRLLNECVACIRDEVVETTDFLDAGIVYGTGFAPFRGGPVQHIKNSGVEKQFKALSDLEIRHGKRFIADDGWQPLLNNKIS